MDDIFNLYFVKWLSGWQVTLGLGQLFAGNFRIELVWRDDDAWAGYEGSVEEYDSRECLE